MSVISKKAAHTDVTQACRRIADGAMMKKAWIGFDQFTSLADALMDGLVVTDVHAGTLDVNRIASEKLRRKEQELVGTRLTRFIMVEDRPGFARHWQDLLSDRAQIRVSEYRARQKYPEAISESTVLPILRDSIGRPKNVVAVFRDRLVILSAEHSERVSGEKAKDIGVRALIVKPFAEQQFAETVRGVLDGR